MNKFRKAKFMSGFTLVEIMIVVAIIALLAAIAIPNVLRGRTTANETAAIGNLRALISGSEMYRSVNNTYPGPDDAAFLAAMVPGAPAPPYVPQPFTVWAGGPTVQGYTYNFSSTTGAAGACTTAGGDCVLYDVDANAAGLGQTGVRSFVADQSGQIRHCLAGAPGADADSTNDANSDATIDGPALACD